MKTIIRLFILLIGIGVLIISVILVIKPGASIFHYKQHLDKDNIQHREGKSYQYPINIGAAIFASKDVILFENDLPLERTFTAEVIEKGLGKYSIGEVNEGRNLLYFSSSDNSNPKTNGRTFTLYFPIIFFTRTLGIILSGTILIGIVWFFAFAVRSLYHRHAGSVSPLIIWFMFNEFMDEELASVRTPITNTQSLSQNRRALWIQLLIFTVAAAYLYVFMEWLFFVTKPSFMDLMGWGEKVELLLISSFVLAILGLLIVSMLAVLDFSFRRLRLTTIFLFAATLVPSIMLTGLGLILFDNFTYTLFNYGIVHTDEIWRAAYGLGFIILFVYVNTSIIKNLGLRGNPKPSIQVSRIVITIAIGLLIVSALMALARVSGNYYKNAQTAIFEEETGQASTHPNIILIGSDGLNATNLSLYDYERETTPVLKELANISLIAENAFANSSNSAGSITSIFTSKPPAQTRVLYPPDILKGTDAYQHLPGVLRREGYNTIEIGVPHYVDAYILNMLDGFDRVNNRSIDEGEVVFFLRELGLGVNAYFTARLVERLTDRVQHIYSINEMENPYTVVTQPVDAMFDRERLSQLKELIRKSERPLFVHVHMMGTHGARFNPDQQLFSMGKTQDQEWMKDFYDDSILNFDRYIGEIVETLEQTGNLDRTILIVYSDHPMRYDVRLRVPLLIHFPNGEFASRITTNVQNMDIATTVLDYLGIQQPDWMVGHSLIDGDPPQDRLIFSSGTNLGVNIGGGMFSVDASRVKPPFYQFTFINVINCQKWYTLDLINKEWSSGDVPGHTMPCADNDLMTMDQIKNALYEYLDTHGFEISTLR